MGESKFRNEDSNTTSEVFGEGAGSGQILTKYPE
jgi:hypothetical protein